MSKTTEKILIDLWDSATAVALGHPPDDSRLSVNDAAEFIDAEIKAARVESLDDAEAAIGEIDSLMVIIEEGASEGAFISVIEAEETFTDLIIEAKK